VAVLKGEDVKVTITGRSMQVHDSVREYAEQKARKLERFSDSLQKIEIILSSRGDSKVAEMIAVPRKGQQLVGQAEHEDQFAALDLVIDKMAGQLRKASDKRKKAKRAGRVPLPPNPSDEVVDEQLGTYEDAVEEFSENLDA
jgi:putative sigma-54 modulation protein